MRRGLFVLVTLLIFNEGQPGRMEPFEASLDALMPLPAVFTSFAVGLELTLLALGIAVARRQLGAGVRRDRR